MKAVRAVACCYISVNCLLTLALLLNHRLPLWQSLLSYCGLPWQLFLPSNLGQNWPEFMVEWSQFSENRLPTCNLHVWHWAYAYPRAQHSFFLLWPTGPPCYVLAYMSATPTGFYIRKKEGGAKDSESLPSDIFVPIMRPRFLLETFQLCFLAISIFPIGVVAGRYKLGTGTSRYKGNQLAEKAWKAFPSWASYSKLPVQAKPTLYKQGRHRLPFSDLFGHWDYRVPLGMLCMDGITVW